MQTIQNDPQIEITAKDIVSTAKKPDVIRVLHIDDDRSVQEITKLMLQDMGNFEVDWACCVDEGLKKLSVGNYDVVVSDYEMPKKNGLEFLRQIKEQKIDVTFILFTGKGREEVAIKALNLGADGYINKQGNPETVYGELSHEIEQLHKQNQIKKELALGEDQFRQFFSHVPSAVAIYQAVDSGEDFIIRDFNFAAQRIEKLSKTDVLGKRVTEVFPGVKAFGIFEVFQRVWKTGKSEYFPIALYSDERVFGTWRENWVMKLPNGNIAAMYNDITDRKLKENALNASEAKLRSIVENSSDQIFMVDKNHRYLMVNKALAKVSGKCDEEIVGKTIHDVFLESGVQFSKNVDKVFSSGKSSFTEEKIVANAQELFVSSSLNPVLDEMGAVIAVTGIVRDITQSKNAEEQIRDLAKFPAQNPNPVMRVDKNGSILFLNDAAKSLLKTLKPKTGRNILPFIDNCVFEVLKTGQKKSVELSQENKFFIFTFSPILEFGYVNVYAIDITNRKIAEKALMENEERFRLYVEHSPVAIFVANQTAQYEYVNQAAARMLEYSVNGLQNMALPQIVFDEDLAATIKAFSSLKDKGSFRKEMRLKTKTGKEVYVDLDAVALPNGKLIAFCADLTKQKALFRELRDSEEKQKMYLENCGIAAFIANSQGKYEYVNQAASKLTGYSSDELCDLSISQLIFSEDSNEKMVNFGKLKTHGSFKDELRLRHKNGHPVLVELNAVKLPDQTLIAFCNDISERKKAEEELLQKYETLESVAENVGAGLAIIGRNYDIIWANKTLMALGVKPNKKCFQTFNHSEDVCPDCGVKKVFEQNLPLDVHEYKAVNSQGEITWIELRVTPLKNKEGIITSALELAVPINERKKTENEVKQSEEKFRSLFEDMAQGGFWQKADGMLLDVNQSALDIFGISRKEFLDRTSESSSWLVIGEDGSNLSGSIHPSMVALRTGKPVNNFVAGIYNPIKKNYVWVSINAIPKFKEGETEPQEVFVTLHDITDLKTTRDALRVSELKYRELINGMSESVWVIDFEGNFLDINTAAYKSLGYSKEELLSLGIKGIDSNLTQDQVKGLINGLPTVGTQIFETIHTAKDGKKIPVEISSSLVAYQGKQAILSIARDITKRKKIADDLQFNQKRFKQAQSVAHIGVWDLAVQSGVLVWSEETCKIFGFPIDIVPSVEKFLDRVHPNDLEFVKKSIDDALNKAKPYNIDMRIIRTDGKTIWANATGEVEYDAEGKATRFFGMFQDITDRKKSEEQQREDNQQIALMNEKLRVVGSLTRHDVGNKLMAAKTNLYLLKNRMGNNPELHKFIEGVNSAIDESSRLFEFSRLYEKIGSQKLSKVDVGACFDEATKMVANQNTLKITNQCRGTNVVADSLLTQLLYNLIENSLKHGEKVSKIKLYFEKAKAVDELFYEDDGVGISQPNKAKLFSEGFTTGNGSGLGLKLIKRMIEVYGWSINEEGTPGKGAKFKITIPKLNQTKSYQISKSKKEYPKNFSQTIE